MAKLTATAVRNAGAAAKSYKLADGGGLYLFVNTKGARYWRYDFLSISSRLFWPSLEDRLFVLAARKDFVAELGYSKCLF